MEDRTIYRHQKWTKAEIHFLEVNYRTMPFCDISRYLSMHSAASIRIMAGRCGLTKAHYKPEDYRHPRYSHMTIKEQAYAMGVSYDAVWKNRRKEYKKQ